MTDQANNYRLALRPFIGRGKHILVIAQPKSGSTALCNILSEVTGWPANSYADRDIYDFAFSPQRAALLADRDSIIHLHALPRPALRAWIAERSAVPVILYRSIPAALVSMYRHQLRSAAAESDRLRSLSYERGIEETAFNWAHWFARFQRQWRIYATAHRSIWVSHSELFQDPGRVAARALTANGVETDDAIISQAVRTVLADHTRSNYHASEGDVPPHLLDAIERLSDDSHLSPSR